MGVDVAGAAAAVDTPPPWFEPRDEPSVILRLHEELLDAAAFLKPSAEEESARTQWLAVLRKTATGLWPMCQLQPYGSVATGLCLPGGTIDVAISNVRTGPHADLALKRMAEKLLATEQVSKIVLSESATSPSLKLTQRSTGLLAEVVLNPPKEGLESTQFIKKQHDRFPALTPLVRVLKLFLLQRGLNDAVTGGMGSYLLGCVVLWFLQQHESNKDAQTHGKTTLGHLLFDFFRYYGQEFKYGENGISVRDAGSLFTLESKGWNVADKNGRPTPTLRVESPTNPEVDIGASCLKIGLVRAAFNHGYHVLGAYIVAKEAPGYSLLCPSLLYPAHTVIANRYEFLKEQPAPLLTVDASPAAPPAKRPRLEAPAPAAPPAKAKAPAKAPAVTPAKAAAGARTAPVAPPAPPCPAAEETVEEEVFFVEEEVSVEGESSEQMDAARKLLESAGLLLQTEASPDDAEGEELDFAVEGEEGDAVVEEAAAEEEGDAVLPEEDDEEEDPLGGLDVGAPDALDDVLGSLDDFDMSELGFEEGAGGAGEAEAEEVVDDEFAEGVGFIAF